MIKTRIAEYTIVQHMTLDKLIAEVNNLITEGWEPHGPLVIHTQVYEQTRFQVGGPVTYYNREMVKMKDVIHIEED